MSTLTLRNNSYPNSSEFLTLSSREPGLAQDIYAVKSARRLTLSERANIVIAGFLAPRPSEAGYNFLRPPSMSAAIHRPKRKLSATAYPKACRFCYQEASIQKSVSLDQGPTSTASAPCQKHRLARLDPWSPPHERPGSRPPSLTTAFRKKQPPAITQKRACSLPRKAVLAAPAA